MTNKIVKGGSLQVQWGIYITVWLFCLGGDGYATFTPHIKKNRLMYNNLTAQQYEAILACQYRLTLILIGYYLKIFS